MKSGKQVTEQSTIWHRLDLLWRELKLDWRLQFELLPVRSVRVLPSVPPGGREAEDLLCVCEESPDPKEEKETSSPKRKRTALDEWLDFHLTPP